MISRQDDFQNKKKEEECIGMNVKIIKTLHKQIKQQALDEDTTVTDVVTKALKKYLSDE